MYTYKYIYFHIGTAWSYSFSRDGVILFFKLLHFSSHGHYNVKLNQGRGLSNVIKVTTKYKQTGFSFRISMSSFLNGLVNKQHWRFELLTTKSCFVITFPISDISYTFSKKSWCGLNAAAKLQSSCYILIFPTSHWISLLFFEQAEYWVILFVDNVTTELQSHNISRQCYLVWRAEDSPQLSPSRCR